MADFVLAITEVTEMGARYCVAGWRPDAKCMVRPLPGARNWTAYQLEKHSVRPGRMIRVTATGAAYRGTYPHRTEDTVVDETVEAVAGEGSVSWFGPGAPQVHGSLEEAFSGFLEVSGSWHGVNTGVFVPAGAQTRSLVALEIEAESLFFFERDYDDKLSLRGQLTDPNGCYNLAVVSRSLRETWRSEGIAAVKTLLPRKGKLHVRVGLARPWTAENRPPNQCYLMINGVYW